MQNVLEHLHCFILQAQKILKETGLKNNYILTKYMSELLVSEAVLASRLPLCALQ